MKDIMFVIANMMFVQILDVKTIILILIADGAVLLYKLCR